jgi:hypothetical protein
MGMGGGGDDLRDDRQPSFSATLEARVITSAAAPSEIEEALAARDRAVLG